MENKKDQKLQELYEKLNHLVYQLDVRDRYNDERYTAGQFAADNLARILNEYEPILRPPRVSAQ